MFFPLLFKFAKQASWASKKVFPIIRKFSNIQTLILLPLILVLLLLPLAFERRHEPPQHPANRVLPVPQLSIDSPYQTYKPYGTETYEIQP